eukprot:6390697-Pyramimonas_sp.AAC.1
MVDPAARELTVAAGWHSKKGCSQPGRQTVVFCPHSQSGHVRKSPVFAKLRAPAADDNRLDT